MINEIYVKYSELVSLVIYFLSTIPLSWYLFGLFIISIIFVWVKNNECRIIKN